MLIINPIGINSSKEYKYNNSKNSVKQFYNPSFGYGLPKFPVGDAKSIHRLNCGCCGNVMLNADDVKCFLKSFAANSKRALEHESIVSKYKDTEAYKFLKELSAIEPKKTIRKLLDIPENRAKVKTLDPRTQIDVNFIALLSDGITVKAPRVMQKLWKYYDFFNKEDKEILDLMEVYSIKYPKKTFSEIFRLPEVIDKHREIDNSFKALVTQQKIEAFKKFRGLFSEIPQNDLKALQVANTETAKILNNGFYQPHIKKALIEELYDIFLKEHPQNRKIKKQIKNFISELHYNSFSPDSFIVNCVDGKKSDYDIVKGFVEKLQATYEHVLPRSKNGSDDIGNGIFLCKKCNQERSDIPYRVFLRFHPEMKKNLQKQLNKIITFIKHKKLLNYDSYPLEIKQTVWENTDNIIKLKINQYLEYREDKAAKNLVVMQAKHELNDKKFKDASKALDDIDAKIEEVMSVIRKLKKERRAIKDEHSEAEALKNISEDEVRNSSARLEKAKNLVEYDKTMNKSMKAKRIKKIKRD